MGKALAQVIPLALAATISPTGLLLVMSIISSKEKPLRKSVLFLLGSALFLIVTGLAVTIFFKPAADTAGEPSSISAVVDIALAVLIALIIGRSVLKQKHPKPVKSRKKRKRPYFAIGFFYMLVNASTLIPFVAACKIIGQDEAGLWFNLLLFTVLLLITMAMVSTPVIIAFAAPKKSAILLGPLESFMTRHGNSVAQAVFAVVAIYLLIHGLDGIRG